MSEAEEVERLKKDLDKCNSIIKVSVRERASESERERNRFLGSPVSVECTHRQVLRRGSMRPAVCGRSCRSPHRVSASLSLQVSVAAQDLIDFTKTRQDPFHPECSPAENPWIGGSKSGRSQRRIGCHGRATQRPRLVSRVARPIPG